MDIGDRIRVVRGELSFGQFAEKLSNQDYTVYKGNVRKYEVGTVVPTTDFYVRIAKVFGISLNWLILGDGPQFTKEQKAYKKSHLRQRAITGDKFQK